MNALPAFRYLAWLTAACVGGFLFFLGVRFGSVGEPEEGSSPAVLLLLGGFCLASQIGLIAAPWSLSQRAAVRIVVALLMAPAAILLGLSAWHAVERLYAGNPVSPLVSALYLLGTFVYGLAYVLLWRTLNHGRRMR